MTEPTAAPPLAIVVLAAGKGTRMKSALHKVLHPIAGRPMIEHLLASVAELSPERQVVVAGAWARAGRSGARRSRGDARCRSRSSAPRTRCSRRRRRSSGFEGDVLILYGDVPLVSAATMRAMLERLHAPDAPAVVVLGFEPADPLPTAGSLPTDGADRARWSSTRTPAPTSAPAACAIRG